MTNFDAPESVVAEVVAAALAEDFGLLGDITSIACIRDDETASAVFVAREEGVLAGTAIVDEVYRQVDSEVNVTWRVDDGDSVETGTELGDRQRLVAIDPRRRTGRAQLPVSLLGSRVADAPLRAGRARQGPHPRHAQDAAGAARGAAGGGAGRRRLQPSRLARDGGVDQGQPSRRARHREGGRPGTRARWPVRTIEVECDTLEQVGEACAAGVDVVMLDNMTPEDVEKAVVAVGRPGQDRGVGHDHSRHRRRLRARPASTSSPSERSPTRSVSLDIGLDVKLTCSYD